jgi:hypothetical protein
MTEGSRQRLLFHYTSLANLLEILDAGELRPSRLRRWFRRDLAVVWLTDADQPGRGTDHGLGPMTDDPALDKRAVRFTVAIADAQHWKPWAARRGVSRRVRQRLDDAGGGLSARWYVVPRPILTDEWVRIDDFKSGERIWPHQDAEAGTAQEVG